MIEQLDFVYERELAKVDLLQTKAARTRGRNSVRRQFDLLTDDPTLEDLAFNHSGLCQTSLPHQRPLSNTKVWRRESGNFVLMVKPGVIDGGAALTPSGKPTDDHLNPDYVGVPFGPKARLIMFHLQTEGLKSRNVYLGDSLAAFLRSLGLESRGGKRGTIQPVQEQTLRIARCSFTFQWNGGNESESKVKDTNIVEGLTLWTQNSEKWVTEVQLSTEFHEHLRAHAVPLDKRAIAALKNNTLGLDLYALLAHRLPRLKKPFTLSWETLGNQLGTEAETKHLARRVRDLLRDVVKVYPAANVEIKMQSGRTPGGLIMRPSPPSVPKTLVNGFRLIEDTSTKVVEATRMIEGRGAKLLIGE